MNIEERLSRIERKLGISTAEMPASKKRLQVRNIQELQNYPAGDVVALLPLVDIRHLLNGTLVVHPESTAMPKNHPDASLLIEAICIDSHMGGLAITLPVGMSSFAIAPSEMNCPNKLDKVWNRIKKIFTR